MNHLIIYAHPNPQSFSASICKYLAKVSKSDGHSVSIRDLYKLNFNPVLSADDFESLRKGITPKDIKTEQRFVTSADFISIVFPLWWTGYPAILKGWIDRVLLNGFAFKHSPKTGITPLLVGKKVQLITTMGASVKDYEENGLLDAMALTMGDNVWSFCGCDDAGLIALGEIPSTNDDTRKKVLKELEQTLRHSISSAKTKQPHKNKRKPIKKRK